MNEPFARLWLALRISNLPLTALTHEADQDTPVVVIQKKRVVFANAPAQEAGATVGMDITTAQLLSGCEVVERNESKEHTVLRALCERMYQFSPYIESIKSEQLAQSGVVLEIASCLKLFGGLESMVQKIHTELAKTTFDVKYGLAHTTKAAWYLSFAHYEITGSETRALFLERLNALPIEVLFDYPKSVEALSKTGFKTLGDLALQINGNSISSFKKRLGHGFTDMLCETFDIDQNFIQNALFEKPRDIYRPDEWFEKEIQSEFPVAIVEHLKPAFDILLQDLCSYLRKRQQQCQYIEWTISDIYRRKEMIKVNSDTPQSHWQLLYDLTLIQFDNKELPFEVDTIRLVCRHTMPLQNASHVLDFEPGKRKRKTVQDFAITVAKLKARLGDSAVYKISYDDSRVPELTNVVITLAEKCTQELPGCHLASLRPSWLLSQPEKIQEQGERLYWHGYLSTLVGPERVIGNWWDAPVARDYYLAKRHDNLPVWIFFNLYDKQWYVHGVFA